MTGILFDLDGTLMDTLDDLHAATNYTLRHFGCPERSREEIRRAVGNGAQMQMRRSLPGLPTDPPVEQVLAFYQAYYTAMCDTNCTARPYPGVVQALQELAKDYPLAIVSNKPDAAVKALCQTYFPGIYARGVSSDCPRKPAPDMVHLTLQEIGADRCIYVGDSEVDILTAKNAGFPCLCVTWGFRDLQTLKEAGAEHLCHHTHLLADAVRQLDA